VAGAISLVATFAFLLVRDYPTAPVVKGRAGEGRLATVARALLMSATALCAYGAGATQLFVISTLTVWLPSYFTRNYAMTPSRAAIVGATAVLLGSFGTLAWARLADCWSLRDARGRLFAPAIGSALTAVLLTIAFVLVPPGPVQLGLIMAAALAMTACYGPVNAVVMDVVQPGLRATATAMVSFFQNILGLAAGPLLIGFISDRYGLGAAFTVLPLFSLVSAGCFLLACRSYLRERDAIAATAS
jgi:MFS family permease